MDNLLEALRELKETTDTSPLDYEIVEHETEWVKFEVTSSRSDGSIFVIVDVDCDESNIDFEWEPDGMPTYVPYGDTQVLYDDGSGGLESVDASTACSARDETYQNEDEEDISEEQACEILQCTLDELQEFLHSSLYVSAEETVAEDLEKYYMDNPPEREDPEPDFYYDED